jgi:hypothetical protein
VAAVLDRQNWTGLHPVARFTGSRWLNTWPRSDENGKPFPSLELIPDEWLAGAVPREWTLWSPERRTTAKVIGTRRDAGCSGPVVLTLEHQIPQPDDRFAAFRVAVNTRQAVEGFRKVTESDPIWREVEPVIQKTFAANEATAVARYPGSNLLSKEDLSAAKMSGIKITVEWLVRPIAETGPVIYYFEATKRAKLSNELPYGTSVTGWLVKGNTGWASFDVEGRVLAEDSALVPMRFPLGLFRLGQQMYWLVGLAGYESWATAIFEVTPTGVRQVTIADGGGC